MIKCKKCGGFISLDSSHLAHTCAECTKRMIDMVIEKNLETFRELGVL